MNKCSMEKFAWKSLAIVLLIIVELCICTHVSYAEQAKDSNFGRYTYSKKTADQLKNKYEKEPITFAKSHKALQPASTIQKPRYRYKSDGIYKSSSVKKDGIATIMLTGDIMCQAKQQKAAIEKYGKYRFDDSFYYVRSIFSKADYVVGNLETTLSESASYMNEESRVAGSPSCNAPSTFLDALRYAGYDMVVCANNHMCDGGVTGVYQTVEHLNQYGIIHTGAFTDKDEPRYVIAEIDGIKVGFVSYTDIFNSKDRFFTTEGKDVMLNKFSAEKAKNDIAACKKAGAEYIIAYDHCGTEYTSVVNDEQKTQAQDLADAGADLIILSHPHVLQKYSAIYSKSGKKVHVLYSMGNFVSQMETHDECKDSIIVRIKLKKDSSGKVVMIGKSYIPCRCITKYAKRNYAVVPITKQRSETSDFKKSLNRSYDREVNVIGPKMVVLGSYRH